MLPSPKYALLGAEPGGAASPPRQQLGARAWVLSAILLLGLLGLFSTGQSQHELSRLRRELEEARLLLLQHRQLERPAGEQRWQLAAPEQMQQQQQLEQQQNEQRLQEGGSSTDAGSSSAGAATGAPSDSAQHPAAAAQAAEGPERQAEATAAFAPPPGTLCIDLVNTLGLRRFTGGVTWEPKNCYAGLKELYPDAAARAPVRTRLMADLVQAAAAARGVAPEQVDADQPWWAALRGQAPLPERSVLSDVGYQKFQVALPRVLSRYLVSLQGHVPAVPCPGLPANMSLAAEDLPLPACPRLSDHDLIDVVGRHPQPWDSIRVIADGVVDPGLCTVPAWGGAASYGDFLMQRMLSPLWHTYNVAKPEEDALLFMMNIFYQAHGTYSRQRFLGVAAQQNPFDFLAIADIIQAITPDVIVETGTANGGSALMWSSLLELSGHGHGRVITVDLEPPGGPTAFGADSELALAEAEADAIKQTGGVRSPALRRQANATDHPLWRRRVTYVHGDSAATETVERVRQLVLDALLELGSSAARAGPAAGAGAAPTAGVDMSGRARRLLGVADDDRASAQADLVRALQQDAQLARVEAALGRPPRVMVLLDSHHGAAHVRAELDAYCPMVTASSYCIVQDTKISRWSDADPGPAAAVQTWLAAHPEFRADRTRELLFTDHPGGYLLRV